jgi:hypothetical protein
MVWEEMGMGLRGEESVGVDSGTWMRERGIYIAWEWEEARPMSWLTIRILVCTYNGRTNT